MHGVFIAGLFQFTLSPPFSLFWSLALSFSIFLSIFSRTFCLTFHRLYSNELYGRNKSSERRIKRPDVFFHMYSFCVVYNIGKVIQLPPNNRRISTQTLTWGKQSLARSLIRLSARSLLYCQLTCLHICMPSPISIYHITAATFWNDFMAHTSHSWMWKKESTIWIQWKCM